MEQQRYYSMAGVRAANRSAGFYFFDPESMRQFGSRVGGTLYGGRYFVTSEQDRFPFVPEESRAWFGMRRYSVREVRPDASIATVGEFGQYSTRAEAIAAIRRLIASEGVDR